MYHFVLVLVFITGI